MRRSSRRARRVRHQPGVAHVLLHLLEVQVLPAEVALGVLVGARELQVEPLGGIQVEAGRLAHQLRRRSGTGVRADFLPAASTNSG